MAKRNIKAKKDDAYWKKWEEDMNYSKLALVEVYMGRAKTKIETHDYEKAKSSISASWYRLIDMEKSIKTRLRKIEKAADVLWKMSNINRTGEIDAIFHGTEAIRDMLRTRYECHLEQDDTDDETD